MIKQSTLPTLSTSKTIITYAWDKTSSHKISGHLPEAIDKFLDSLSATTATSEIRTMILIPEVDSDIQERIKLLIKDKYKPEYHELILNNIVFDRPTSIICSSDIIFVDGGLPDANIFLITNQDPQNPQAHESNVTPVGPSVHLELCSKDIWFLSRFKNIKTIKSTYSVQQDATLKLKNKEHIVVTNIVIKYSSIFQSRIKKNLKQLGIEGHERQGIHDIFDSVNQIQSGPIFRFWYNNQFQKNINIQYYNYEPSKPSEPKSLKFIRGFKGLKRFKKRNLGNSKPSKIKGRNRILIYAPGNCRSLGDLSTKVNFAILIKEIKLILDLFESPEILYLGANPKDTFVIDSIELLEPSAPVTFVKEDDLPYMNLFQSFDTYFYTGTIGEWDCNPRLLKESYLLNKAIIISEFVSRKRNDSCNVPINEILQKIKMKDNHSELKEMISQESKATLATLNHLKERRSNAI